MFFHSEDALSGEELPQKIFDERLAREERRESTFGRDPLGGTMTASEL